MIERILNPNAVVEKMVSGTYQRALDGDLDAIHLMGN